MSPSELVHQAIQTARAGRRTEARDLLIQVVERDPQNELAWMWLAGLVDSLEDRIIACENVLTINPANEKARAYLTDLQRRQQAFLAQKNLEDAADLLNQARARAGRNDIDSALRLARQALEKRDQYEDAWLLIGRIAPDLDQQIEALEKARALNPSNPESVSALRQAKYLKANPISHAARLERMGKFEDALNVYKDLASQARNSKEFDHIYKQLLRIEGLRNENIRYVAPSASIKRLTFVWPLLYFSLALVQVGLNPLAHPAFYLLAGTWAHILFILVQNDSGIPSIGASGAIFGLMGAYLLLYPGGRIRTLVFISFVPLWPGIRAIRIVLYLVSIQIIPAIQILLRKADYSVNHWAHLGGFFSAIFILLFLRPEAFARYLSDTSV